MNQLKYVRFILALPVLLFSFAFVSAQTDADRPQPIEQSYEIALHVVIGSPEAGPGAPLPASLATVSKHIRSNFSYPNYRLVNTLLVRTSNNGTMEHKGVSNILGLETDAEAQSFLEWTMSGIRVGPTGMQVRPFRFVARIPVRMSTARDSSGGTSPIVSYEQVGLNVGAIGMPMNTPTLVGTISLPRTLGTIFLITTIRNPEM